MVQTDAKRTCKLQEGPINMIHSMKRSRKMRIRKMAPRLSNMKTGLTSVGADSGKRRWKEKAG